jgi:glycosyltransferase involved in cell wall biosynthesis
MKPKIFLLYPYYYPHYKSGGPVQSIYNLASYFRNDVDFFLVSLNRDIDNSSSEIPVVCGSWQQGPQGENIFYTSSISFFLLFRLIKEIRPKVIFVNGLFNASTTLPGVVLARMMKIKLFVSPRGMLQSWALQQKRTIMKKLYIRLLKMILSKQTTWHATDEQEKNDILKNFGQGQSVHFASNVPRQMIQLTLVDFPAEDNKIKLVFLSLINPNKNLHLIIDQVKRLSGNFTLDIYGPVRNVEYWDKCLQEFSGRTDITYKGEVPSWKVQQILSQYHFFVLPTQGENFGHAIFDALSCGVPVIISKNTPWVNIENSQAGFYMDIDNQESISFLFNRISNLSAAEYQTIRQSSLTYATNYFKSKDFSKEYSFLLQ